MYIEVVRLDGELKREVWRFGLGLNFVRLLLWLNSYALEERATKRHKWHNLGLWHRLDMRPYCSTIAKPPLPADVVAEAKRRICDAVNELQVKM